jgi:hypothetical protein
MLIHEKKKALQTLMMRRGEKGGPVTAGPAPMQAQMSMTEPGDPDGRLAAAQDAMAAFHNKDPQKLVEALGNFHDIHSSMNEAEPTPEE